MNPSAVFDFFLCQRNILQMDAAFGHSGLNGLFQRFRLLHDFLHHEVIIAALFCRRDIPCDMINLFRDFLAVYIIQLYAVIFQHGNFICFQQIIISGVFQQGGNIGCDIIFALAQTNQQRAVLSDCNQCIGMICTHNAQSVCAADFFQQLSCSGDHIPII